MFSKILVGAAVWMASNSTGRKVAVTGYKTLVKLGNCAVRAMPNEISGIFTGTEKFIKDLSSDTANPQERTEN